MATLITTTVNGTLTTTNNVGIGALASGVRLNVQGPNAILRITGDTYTSVELSDGGTGDPGYAKVFNYGSLVAQIGEGGTFFNTGNIGIGTTGPSAKLDVVSGGSALLNLQNTENNFGANQQRIEFYGKWWSGSPNSLVRHGTIAGEHGTGDGYQRGNLKFYTNADGNVVDAMTIFHNGNVGIGTAAPSTKLEVVGGYVNIVNAEASSGTLRIGAVNGLVGLYSSGMTAIRADAGLRLTGRNLNVGTSSDLEITTAGNVGIGTTAPSYKLDVTGDVRINTGALGVNIVPSATDGRIDASNDIVAFNSSDERLKENIIPITNALDKVKSLTGVEFDWKPEHKKAHGHEGRDTGIIAQQVLAIMPTAVRTNDTGFLAVRYEKLIGLLIEGMKEQQAQIDELKAKLK